MAVQRQVGSQMDAKPSVSDLRTRLYHFAKRVAGGFDLCGVGQLGAGVIQEGKNIGEHTTVATGNQLKVVAGGAIPPASRLASDANGRAVVAVAGAAGAGVPVYVLGQSINQVARAAGELVEIEFAPNGSV